MSILVKATPAPTARTKETKQMAYLYAGLLVVLAVTQLFTFDEFIELVPAFNLPFGTGFTYALAPLIVATEVFAIPFLLRMQLSVAFRWLSMFCGWFVRVRMANQTWTPNDYLVLIKAYILADTRHKKEEVDEDFWITINEAYKNHPECRLRRRNLDTRSTFITFTRACRRY